MNLKQLVKNPPPPQLSKILACFASHTVLIFFWGQTLGQPVSRAVTAGGKKHESGAGGEGGKCSRRRGGEKRRVKEDMVNKKRKKSRRWCSAYNWLSAVCLLAGGLPPASDLELPQDNHNLCQLNTARQTERKQIGWVSGHSADPSTSPEEIIPTHRGLDCQRY